MGGHAGDPGHLQFVTGLENGNVQIRTEGVNNCDIVLFPKGGIAGTPLAPGGKIVVNLGAHLFIVTGPAIRVRVDKRCLCDAQYFSATPVDRKS